MREDETAYCVRRAAEELTRAEQATNPQVAEAHREMHRRYLQRVEQEDCKKIPADEPASVQAPMR